MTRTITCKKNDTDKGHETTAAFSTYLQLFLPCCETHPDNPAVAMDCDCVPVAFAGKPSD